MEYKKEKIIQQKNNDWERVGKNAIQLKDNRSRFSDSQSTNITQLKEKTPTNVTQLVEETSKPFWVPGPGKGFIPFMGAQFDGAYRDPQHKKLLDDIPEDQCPVKTFHQENDYAARFPYEGSKSKLGDTGIKAHRIYNRVKNLFNFGE
ncbi:hypothetical protein [Tenacibaculum sp.]|uniref:hypothetical protein n=1 Tax=Tenacibaculum sp. TaxID=1906242 RepID=UPI003AA858BD